MPSHRRKLSPTPFALPYLLMTALVCNALAPNVARADETTPTKATTPDAPSADPLAEWQKLQTRKAEIYKQLLTLKKEHAEAKEARKLEIAQEYNALIREFEQSVYQRLSDIAEAVWKAEPGNSEAAQLVMETAFGKNRFERSAQIADRLLAAGSSSKLVLNIAGVSHFALNNFERAHELLSRAEKEDVIIPSIGGPYVEASQEYIALWKVEQELRQRESAATGDDALPRVEIETNRGKIVLELFENEAPNTVANFISLVEAGTYDGTKFHRVLPRFMIQGGDPNSTDDDPDNDGLGGPGYTIKCECDTADARMHFGGSLSMAHAGKNTGGSQFFITHLPTPHLNPNPAAGSGHTVFGRVLEGMEIVATTQEDDKIKHAKVIRKRNHDYTPKTTPDQ